MSNKGKNKQNQLSNEPSETTLKRKLKLQIREDIESLDID